MPVDMPDYAFTGIGALPDLGITSARSEGGIIITSRQSDPNWTGPLTTRPLGFWAGTNEHADMMAFLSDCVEMNRRVDFVHPMHQLPMSYTESTFPMVGNGQLVSVTDLRTVVIRDMPVGLILKRGDRLSIMQGEMIAHRWIAAPMVVNSTLSQSISLTPRLPFGVFAPGATVAIKNPKMRVMIIPGSWDANEVAEASPITFEVAESLT